MRVYLSFFGCPSGRDGDPVRESEAVPDAVREALELDPYEPVYETDAAGTPAGRCALAALLRRRLLRRYHEAVCTAYVPNDACTVERRLAVDIGGRSRDLRFSFAPGTLLHFARFTAPGWQALGKRAAVYGKDLLFLSLFRERGFLHLQFALPDDANAPPVPPVVTVRDHLLTIRNSSFQCLMPEKLTVGPTEADICSMGAFSTRDCCAPYAQALRLYYESRGLLPAEWSGRHLVFYDAVSNGNVPESVLPALTLTVAFREQEREILLQRPFSMRVGAPCEDEREIPFTDPDDGSAHTITALRAELEDLRANALFHRQWTEDLEALVPPDHVLAVLAFTGEDSYYARFCRREELEAPYVSRSCSMGFIFSSKDGLRRHELGAVPKDYAGELALELFSVTRRDPIQPVRLELEQNT